MPESSSAGPTPAWLERYLTDRLRQAVRVEALEKFGRGTSRETWFGRYRPDGGEAVEIVLRADHPAGSVDPTPLDQEYFIYDRLGGAGLPVAQALWWEADASEIGRPFYVREKIAGSWSVPGYLDPDQAFDSLRIAIAQEHVRALAQVHALDWRRLGFEARLTAPASGEDAVHSYIRDAKARVAEKAGEAVPIFLEACEWLEDHAPVAPRLCLCKGTNGLGEEVFRGGRLVALSDWEEVCIGDPARDFAFMQGFADPIVRDGREIWGLQPALDFYESVSGFRIDAGSVRFYQVIRSLAMVVFSRNAAIIAHESGGRATIRQVWTATEVMHVGKHILATAMGMLPPTPPELFRELNESVEMV